MFVVVVVVVVVVMLLLLCFVAVVMFCYLYYVALLKMTSSHRPTCFLASRYAEHQTRKFTEQVKHRKFKHNWWIRGEFNIDYTHLADLNIVSCLPDKELELYGCTVPELGMELCVRDTGPGEYFIQVRICHKHTDIVMYSSAVIDICSL